MWIKNIKTKAVFNISNEKQAKRLLEDKSTYEECTPPEVKPDEKQIEAGKAEAAFKAEKEQFKKEVAEQKAELEKSAAALKSEREAFEKELEQLEKDKLKPASDKDAFKAEKEAQAKAKK